MSAPQNDIERIINTSSGLIRRTSREPLTILHFETQYTENDGTISEAKLLELKKYIYNNGIANDEVRKEVWPYILGYRDCNMKYETYTQEEKFKISRLYKTYKSQWMTISADQESRFTEYANKKHLIEKGH